MTDPLKNKTLYYRVLPTTIIGNALEFYDFTLYAIFAVSIGKLFFPSEDPTASLIASWGAFAAGFMMRPLGALVFGSLGDKYGRKFSLSFTILLTGFPTLVIALLPGYEQLGILAPIILILCRLCQGLCTGGEYNGAAIFALEHFGKLKPGMIGGFITASCLIGSLAATFSGFLVSTYGTEEMWRLPFFFGAFISFVGFILRYKMNETPDFALLEKKKIEKKWDLKAIYAQYSSSALLSFMLGALNGALSYTLFGFLNVYLSKYLGLEASVAMKYNLLGLFFFMCCSPFAGHLLDIYGRTRFMLGAALLVLVSAFPTFLLLQTYNPFFILCGQALLGILTASIAGAGHGYMQPLFPTHVRLRGISINFSLGMALCGGTAPMLFTYLIESSKLSLYVPAFYLIGLASLFLFTVFYFSQRTGAERIEPSLLGKAF
jgi:MHS family proline/betaine transporter-like MFS transporter